MKTTQHAATARAIATVIGTIGVSAALLSASGCVIERSAPRASATPAVRPVTPTSANDERAGLHDRGPGPALGAASGTSPGTSPAMMTGRWAREWAFAREDAARGGTNPYPFAGFDGVPRGGAALDPEPMGFGPVQRVTFSRVGADFDPTMTPDGRRLVFASTQHRKTSDIYIKDLGGLVVTQITNDPADDVMPAVSPDGTRIAFASNRGGNWDLYIAPISGGHATRVTSDPADELHPTWSPCGTKLAFCRMGEASSRWELWVTPATAGVATEFLGFGMFPKWCPVSGTGAEGSDRILFQVGRERGSRTFGVWTLDYMDGRAWNATELAGSPTAALINPTWSDDGRRVVFAEVPLDGVTNAASAPRVARLWMQNIDGTGRVRLTEGNAVALMPFWGRGDRVVFMSSKDGVENIWSLDAAPAIAAADGAGQRVATSPSAPATPAGTTASAPDGP
ncbi:MAG: PD40 domain-containing protein [Phycisphaeraceae bacterium]|nr:MAG: PD40 domain-containing protein [Phycisphaeraceae bacterium]